MPSSYEGWATISRRAGDLCGILPAVSALHQPSSIFISSWRALRVLLLLQHWEGIESLVSPRVSEMLHTDPRLRSMLFRHHQDSEIEHCWDRFDQRGQLYAVVLRERLGEWCLHAELSNSWQPHGPQLRCNDLWW